MLVDGDDGVDVADGVHANGWGLVLVIMGPNADDRGVRAGGFPPLLDRVV